MIPGEFFLQEQPIELNADCEAFQVEVFNCGDRPIQVGSHYHFYETNEALIFDREATHGARLDIASGTAARFEPGQRRSVGLIHYSSTTPQTTP